MESLSNSVIHSDTGAQLRLCPEVGKIFNTRYSYLYSICKTFMEVVNQILGKSKTSYGIDLTAKG